MLAVCKYVAEGVTPALWVTMLLAAMQGNRNTEPLTLVVAGARPMPAVIVCCKDGCYAVVFECSGGKASQVRSLIGQAARIRFRDKTTRIFFMADI